jgi:hypothetical protein
MNTIQIFKDAPFSKSEQENFVALMVSDILAGSQDALAVDLRLKAMADVIEAIRKDKRVKDAVISEAEKYGKTFDLHGAKITVSARTTKDFTNCGDDLYNDLIMQQGVLKAQITAREAMIATGVNPETGQIYAPPQTFTTEFLSYKFK